MPVTTPPAAITPSAKVTQAGEFGVNVATTLPLPIPDADSEEAQRLIPSANAA
jgi:hypothetical protein